MVLQNRISGSRVHFRQDISFLAEFLMTRCRFSRGELGLAEKPVLLRLGVGGAEIIVFVYICHCSGSAGRTPSPTVAPSTQAHI